MKVYKGNITPLETTLSGGKLIGFPDKFERHKIIEIGDVDVQISVYVCYDFLVENISKKRSDMIFVPQCEASPESYIAKANDTSREFENFVIGANNSDNNQRSIGFVPSLNKQVQEGLALKKWREKRYPSGTGRFDDEHHTISYDLIGEKIIVFELNLGNPISKVFTSRRGHNPLNFKPIKMIDL